jgi:Porin subfamily/YadA-like membrane anchor domain
MGGENIMSRILFGLAAAILAIAAFGAEAKAQDYVEICDIYGVDYYYSPGTQTCINARDGWTKEQIGGMTVDGQTEIAKKADEAVEGSAAAAALSRPFVESGHTFAISGDIANAGDTGAASLGAAYRFNENLTVSGSGAYTQSGTGATRAGFNLSW